MKYAFNKKPRIFTVKASKIFDMGKIFLKGGEMVTFVTRSEKECDFAATKWGFYLGPSLNSRLKKNGFKVALVHNEKNQLYVMAVENNKITAFNRYLKRNCCIVICWLDEWLTIV